MPAATPTAPPPPGATGVSDSFVKAFAAWEQAAGAGQPAWLLALRRAGLARFGELGFPTLKHEDWRFTNVAPIARLPFRPQLEAGPVESARAVVAQAPFRSLPGTRLVFVNGHFAPELSTTSALPPGARVGSLAAVLATDPGLVEQHLGRTLQAADNAFASLNSAFFTDGGFVHVPAGQAVEGVVHLLFVQTATEPGATCHPRNLIVAGAGARVTVVETYLGAASAATLTNAVTEFALGDEAVVEHGKLQDEGAEAFHVAALHSHLGRGVQFTSHSVVTGARLSRNNIRTTLAGPNIEAILNGVYLTNGEQLADHHMVVDHAQPHCASHEYFNGILAGKSRGVFHGRILVRPGAQKTDAKQTNKNLLLSDDASADAKPQLEIYADDVKCTHGATVGQLNEESIYYLRSRGIGQETARRMLIHAFAGEIIDRVKHEALREELDRMVWDRLEELDDVTVGR
ncbi:MAG: FeS cluster assembly protein SufD [Verrucomicrobiota bacterium]|jgi:Fe-S cluster assembly protein SufD